MKNIEVEMRTFIDEKTYYELLDKYDSIQERQITTYFDCKQDFRLMVTNNYCKLWLKEGLLHDDFRNEYEVKFDIHYINSLKGMLENLGYKEEIKWYRKRNIINIDTLTLTIDYSIGYGYIIECEKIVQDENQVEDAKLMISKFFNEIGINTISKKEEFSNKFSDYKLNWKKYLEDINDEIFLKGDE